MSKKAPVAKPGKSVRFTAANRIEAVNNILKVLFGEKIATLQQDMQTRAEAINQRAHAAFFSARADEQLLPYLASNRDTVFRYAKVSASGKKEVHKLVVPKLHLQDGAKPIYGKLGTTSFGYYSNTDIGVVIHVTGPGDKYNSEGYVCGLNANEARAIAALESRARQLEANFDAVRQQLISAVGAHKTVAEFYAQFPEFEKAAGIAAYEAPKPAYSTALVPARASVMDVLRSAGVLPALRTHSPEPAAA